MISLPDFKEKQMLFIRAGDDIPTGIKLDNENIVFTQDGKPINRLSCHKVFVVFILGDLTVTSRLLRDGNRYGISFFFLKNNFETYATLGASAEGNYLLRMKQYDLKAAEEMIMARQIVSQKIHNQFLLLKNRDKDSVSNINLDEVLQRVQKAYGEQELLGIEGEFSRKFFSSYFSEMKWVRRTPRAKIDVTNFLMDMGYTFLFNFVDSLLRLHGFDTYKGIYHKMFFQRRSLACDLMEPFRCIIDHQIVKSYNLGQIHEKDFSVQNGKVSLSFDKNYTYVKIFTEAIMAQKENIFSYVHGFYRHMMRDTNPFPRFEIDLK